MSVQIGDLWQFKDTNVISMVTNISQAHSKEWATLINISSNHAHDVPVEEVIKYYKKVA